MNVYLLNMPFHEEEYTRFSEKWDLIEDEYLGISIVHSILLNHNCNVKLCTLSHINDILDEIIKLQPDVLMISVMQSSARRSLELITSLRYNHYSGVILIGGWFAKLAWKEIFLHNWPIDYVCYVNAEGVLDEWLENPSSNIFGIATYNNFTKQLLFNEKLLNNEKSWINNYIFPHRKQGRKTYCIETSRGCPHSLCTFCSQSKGNCLSNKWTALPLEIVKKQIIDLHNSYGAVFFATTDDDLAGPLDFAEQRINALSKLIKSLPFKISFTASISVKAATNPKILDMLLDCGLIQLCLGFESADEIQLKRYCKSQSLEDNFVAAREVLKRRIPILPGLITFDPFATINTINKNISFLFNELHHYEIGKLTKKLHILTGTPMERLVRKENLLIGDYLYYEYRFQHKEVNYIYENFKKYTKAIKENYMLSEKKIFSSKEILRIHKTIINKILNQEPWEQDANNLIFLSEELK